MARSWLKRRQDAEREREAAYEASLRRVSQRGRLTPDFETALAEAARGFGHLAVRPPAAWRPHVKSRDPARLRLAAARHLFQRYPVPEHLDRVWLDTSGLGPDEVRLRTHWYVLAATGGSLYKGGANEWLSRKEVHAFLTAPRLLTFEQAFWYAVARSYTADLGVALRIARSAMGRERRADFDFWRTAVRFFATNAVGLDEIGDLRDYIADCRRRDVDYSLDGRTLVSLTRQMHVWHQDLAAIGRIEAMRRRAADAAARADRYSVAQLPEGGRWPGAPIVDWSWQPSVKGRDKRPGQCEEYRVIQLTSATDLVTETRAMNHCVASYAMKCIAGRASIWSLRHRAAGTTSRLLTIELDAGHRVVQVRGFANRAPHVEELKVLERWAKARGIDMPPR